MESHGSAAEESKPCGAVGDTFHSVAPVLAHLQEAMFLQAQEAKLMVQEVESKFQEALRIQEQETERRLQEALRLQEEEGELKAQMALRLHKQEMKRWMQEAVHVQEERVATMIQENLCSQKQELKRWMEDILRLQEEDVAPRIQKALRVQKEEVKHWVEETLRMQEKEGETNIQEALSLQKQELQRWIEKAQRMLKDEAERKVQQALNLQEQRTAVACRELREMEKKLQVKDDIIRLFQQQVREAQGSVIVLEEGTMGLKGSAEIEVKGQLQSQVEDVKASPNGELQTLSPRADGLPPELEDIMPPGTLSSSSDCALLVREQIKWNDLGQMEKKLQVKDDSRHDMQLEEAQEINIVKEDRTVEMEGSADVEVMKHLQGQVQDAEAFPNRELQSFSSADSEEFKLMEIPRGDIVRWMEKEWEEPDPIEARTRKSSLEYSDDDMEKHLKKCRKEREYCFLMKPKLKVADGEEVEEKHLRLGFYLGLL